MGLPCASSRCWPLAWPSRGKMGARLGGRTHSIVVGDLSSTHQRDWSAIRVLRTPSWWRANQSDQVATASGERGSSTEKRKNRSLPHAHREQKEKRTNQHRELLQHEERGGHQAEEPPLSVTFIPRVCKSPDPKGPVGGATSPIGREKRGRVFLRIRTLHTRVGHVP